MSLSDPKQLYRSMEAVLGQLDTKEPARRQASKLCSALWKHLRSGLQIQTLRAYECTSDSIDLICGFGEICPAIDLNVDEILGAAINSKQDLPLILHGIGSLMVIIGSGVDESILLLFSIEASTSRETPTYLTYAFSALQYATEQHGKKLELVDALEQARAIQMSLLPQGTMKFHDFEISALSIPARVVGGDIYDYQRIEDDYLALTFADASGHGLPAALQARDVVIGLRVGRSQDSDSSALIRKLNRVIHSSGLSSRFVSLVYGELSQYGVFRYVNAGHPAPLLCADGFFTELKPTGMILGPTAFASYEERTVTIPPSGTLLMFSDGIVEHTSQAGDEYGVKRLKELVSASFRLPAAAALKQLFVDLLSFGGQKPIKDDATALLVRRRRREDNLQF